LLDARAVGTQKGKSHSQRKITNLLNHPEPYVTTSDLAGYWRVSRKQIYKQIDAGTLKAIRLGPRLLRISTTEAIRFEEMAKLSPEPVEDSASQRSDRRDAERGNERPRAVAADSHTPQSKQPQRPPKK
jgi:excisionase family DNA binding protein